MCLSSWVGLSVAVTSELSIVSVSFFSCILHHEAEWVGGRWWETHSLASLEPCTWPLAIVLRWVKAAEAERAKGTRLRQLCRDHSVLGLLLKTVVLPSVGTTYMTDCWWEMGFSRSTERFKDLSCASRILQYYGELIKLCKYSTQFNCNNILSVLC